jgi:glycosyltransferase involved in cell wall biosynthesis
MVVLEAMQAGLPLIVSRVGALPEVLKDGENCIFINAGDVSECAAALDRIKADAGLRRRMATANLALASRFSIDGTAADVAAIFQRVSTNVA